MAQLYDSLKGLVCPDMVKKIAKTVDEKPENVKQAVSAVIPSLLALYLKKHNPRLNNFIREAGNLDIVNSKSSICDDNLTEDQARISDSFLQEMIGDRAADFTDAISESTNISKVAGNRLIYIVSALVAGFLGERLKKDGWSESRLLDELRQDKTAFAKDIPAKVVKAFDLSNILKGVSLNSAPEKSKKEGGNGWIWILVIIALLLLAFFGWKSCKNDIKKDTKEVATVVTTAVDKSVKEVEQAVDNLGFFDLKLPDGKTIHIKKKSVEDKIVEFLKSDEYKNASSKDLEHKWFEFKDVDFEFNSSTDLKAGSEAELENVAAILKAFKDAKIQIAGFADKKGTEDVNMNISKERAKTVEFILEQKGVASQIVKTEGFGERFAKHAESETDDQRAEDRDFALRFVK